MFTIMELEVGATLTVLLPLGGDGGTYNPEADAAASIIWMIPMTLRRTAEARKAVPGTTS